MIFYRHGEYPPCDTKSLLEYLNENIQMCRVKSLEARVQNNERRFLIYEAARAALEDVKESLLYSIENKIR